MRKITLIIFSLYFAIPLLAQNPLLDYAFREKIRTANPVVLDAIGSIKQADEGEEGRLTNNDDDIQEGEPFIAINPTDSLNIVISYMQLDAMGSLAFPVYSSFDGGESWAVSSYQAAAELVEDGYTFPAGGGDPILAFDNNGRLYFSFLYLAFIDQIDLFTFAPRVTTYWAYSDDGGLTFETPSDNIIASARIGLLSGAVTEGDGFLDRPWFAVDRSGGACDGMLYASGWFIRSDTSALPSGMVVRRKLPGVDAFEDVHVRASVDTLVQFGNVQTDDNGTLHIVYGNLISDNIMYAFSTDCGASFSTPVAVGDFVWDENSTDFAIIDRDNPASGLGVAAETGNPHVVWTSFENGQSTAYYARSTDAGATWETPVNFNDLLPESNTQAYFPNLAVSPSGKVSVSWFDLDSLDSGLYTFAESQDGGANFSDITPLSTAPTPFAEYNICDPNNPYGPPCLFFGDYFGSTRTECKSYSVWADGRESQGPKIYVGITSHCDNVTSTTDFYPITDKISLQSLFPNPANERVNLDIELKQNTDLMIDLYDTQGRVIQQFTQTYANGQHQISLDIGDLSAGVYVVKIASDFGVISKHFVKE